MAEAEQQQPELPKQVEVKVGRLGGGNALEASKVILGLGICGLMGWSAFSSNLKDARSNAEAQRAALKAKDEIQNGVLKDVTVALTKVADQGGDLEAAMRSNTKVLNRVYDKLGETAKAQDAEESASVK